MLEDICDDLWALLAQYDRTWHIVRDGEFAVVLQNEHAEEIHAPNLELALRAAIDLYDHQSWDTMRIHIMSQWRGMEL